MGLGRQVFNFSNRLPLSRAARRGFVQAAVVLRLLDRLPRFVMIETSSVCHLGCPLCPVRPAGIHGGGGFMELAAYRRLVDEIASYARRVRLDYAGEPLLHPDIFIMIDHAERRGLRTSLSTSGNVTGMAGVVDAGLSELIVSVDGITEATYRQYRVGGSLERALANLVEVLDRRRRRDSRRPRVCLQFIVMRHNEHEIDGAIALGRRLGVDEVWLLPVGVGGYSGPGAKALQETYLPRTSVVTRYRGQGRAARLQRPHLCEWAFQAVVRHDGRVATCAHDAAGTHILGNAFEPGGFAAAWRSEQAIALRRQALAIDLPLCQGCDHTTVPTRRIVLAS